MTSEEQDAADAAQTLRAHQQLYNALTEFEAQLTNGVNDGVQHDAHVKAYRRHQNPIEKIPGSE